jgi:hypothetical protein
MTESRKAWVTPELIVLVRSKPEEAVLLGCKRYGAVGPGAALKNRCVVHGTKCVLLKTS